MISTFKIAIPFLLLAIVSATAFGSGTVIDILPRALSDNPAESARAIEQLRVSGPAALDQLFARRDQLQKLRDAADQPAIAAEVSSKLAKLDAVIDRVGGQRYCTASRLYWYTDLEQAQKAAVASGKPILSLRMMGYLTDEYSCANSRFFRTSLYANQEISTYLRDHFVLHWKSVRPVPKVTIDFGDGRKLERTLTGNSAHYVLAADGRPLDVLPGLYGPAKFLQLLKRDESLAAIYQQAESPQVADQMLVAFHSSQGRRIISQWAQDLELIGQDNAPATDEPVLQVDAAAPRAEAAALIARPKSAVEMPLIRLVTLRVPPLEIATGDQMWEKIAALHRGDAQLDAASVALIRQQNAPDARKAGRLSITKGRVEDPILKLVNTFQSSIALDTVRNEYRLHRQIHEWFAASQVPADVETLNERVYAELFLTPSSDPWIGLVQPDTYTALENNGIVE